MGTTKIKVCSKCKIEKPLVEFNVLSSASDGRRPECKVCRKAGSKKYYVSNSIQIKAKVREYEKKVKVTRDAEREIQYAAYKNQLEAEKIQKKLHQKRLKSEADRRYQLSNRDKVRLYAQEYYVKNIGQAKSNMAEYREKNKDLIRIIKKNYKIERLASDPIYKLKFNLATLIRNVIKSGGYQKNARTSEVLGADWETVKAHIESMFDSEMSWENQGKWHFDHIIPISLANNENAVLALNHYSNLRPLWGKENIAKSNKLPPLSEIERYGLRWLLDIVQNKV